MKVTKRDRGIIKKLAKQLPFQQIINHEVVSISGEDLLLSGHTQVEGSPIIKEQTYYLKNPVYREIHHDKRMIRQFQNFGLPGLISYVTKFVQPEKKAEAKNRLKQIWSQ